MTGRDDKASRGAHPMRIAGSSIDLRKTGVRRFDLRDPYHFAVTLSWGGFALVMLGCLLAINVVFAALYLAEPGAVVNLAPRDVFSAFFFSLETLATVGYGEMAPASLYGHAVAGLEIIVGMTFTAIMTGLLFVRFSKPQARILFADKLVVTAHNGRPTLMLRIANGRLSMLTHASARIGVLLAQTTEEGQLYRSVHDLVLVRQEIPLFPLTWTLMHVLDAASPLHGATPQMLESADARFFLAVEARDTGLGARVQDIRDFSHGDVVFGMRYADIVSRKDQGPTIADLAQLSALESEAAARPAGAANTSGGMV